MKKIILKCQTLSPIFMGNANDKNAELRPSSFEGSLRFWWRALHPSLSSFELRKQETEFFGGNYIDENETINKPPSYRFLSVSNLRQTDSMIQMDERGGKGSVYAIEINTPFEIKLHILRNREKVIALFKLASALGGIGKRSRRGAGAWQILSITSENNQSENIQYKRSSIDKWLNIINKNRENTSLSNIFPFLKENIIGNIYDSSNSLRMKIMKTASTVKYINGNIYKIYLGDASARDRLSSPIYVSLIKDRDDIKPIISSLNFKPSTKENHEKGVELQTKFINAILNNTEVKKDD